MLDAVSRTDLVPCAKIQPNPFNFNSLEGDASRGEFSKERFCIDPYFRERSLTKRFVSARSLSFFGIIKNFDPSSFSHVTLVFLNN